MDNNLILNKIKTANELKTDTELANFLGVSKYTLSNWRKRGTIDFDVVLSKCVLFDFNWLFNEKTEEVLNIKTTPQHPNPENNKNNSDLLNNVMDKYKAIVIENYILTKKVEDLERIINSSKS